MQEIKVKFAGIEKGPDGKFSIIYIPDQTQMLQAGQKYRIVIEGLTYRDGWFTKKEVCEILGVDHKKVQAWIDSGALIATWHNGRRPQKNGMSMWHIEAADLRKFIINYCSELMGRNVDLQQIVWLLTVGNE